MSNEARIYKTRSNEARIHNPSYLEAMSNEALIHNTSYLEAMSNEARINVWNKDMETNCWVRINVSQKTWNRL